jgi:tRNA nucleotidyltransferase (CCA-adding enzyme)
VQAAVAAGTYHCVLNGFNAWLASLHPTAAEKARGRAVVAAVKAAAERVSLGKAWSVSAVHVAGSFAKSTSLRGA